MSATANGPMAKPNAIERCVDVFGIGALLQHELALAAIGGIDAVADEPFADARDDRRACADA